MSSQGANQGGMDQEREKGSGRTLRRRALSAPTLIAFVLAGAFLAFLFTRFDIDLEEVGRNLSESNPLLYGSAMAIYYLSFVARGFRWRVMMKNVEAQRGGEHPVPGLMACSSYILLGWFANSITIFRLGEAYRTYLVSEATGASFSRTAGTILTERALDLFLVFGLLGAAVLFAAATGEIGSFAKFLLIAFGLMAAAGLILLFMRQFGLRLAGRFPVRIQETYQRFHQGALLSLKQLPLVSALGLAAWACEVARLYFVVQALGFTLPFSMIVFVSMTHSVLTAIPITPGGLGLSGPGMVGLLMLRLSQTQAVAVALLDRTITYLSIVVFGGLFFIVREARRQLKGSTPVANPEARL